jgi:hypothetical protein
MQTFPHNNLRFRTQAQADPPLKVKQTWRKRKNECPGLSTPALIAGTTHDFVTSGLERIFAGVESCYLNEMFTFAFLKVLIVEPSPLSSGMGVASASAAGSRVAGFSAGDSIFASISSTAIDSWAWCSS